MSGGGSKLKMLIISPVTFSVFFLLPSQTSVARVKKSDIFVAFLQNFLKIKIGKINPHFPERLQPL